MQQNDMNRLLIESNIENHTWFESLGYIELSKMGRIDELVNGTVD